MNDDNARAPVDALWLLRFITALLVVMAGMFALTAGSIAALDASLISYCQKQAAAHVSAPECPVHLR